MKSILLALAAVCGLSSIPVLAADSSTPPPEVKAVVEKVQAKISSGKQSEADFEPEFKEFDALAAKYSSDPETAAKVLFMKGMLYVQILKDAPKGTAIFNEIKTKYPQTDVGSKIDQVIASMKQQDEAKQVNAALVPGKPFPPFDVKDLDGKPLSIASRKAKVILIDFWATWCGPCVRELPNVVATYDKFHGKGFDVIGISLDKDQTALADFIKQNKMPWPQYFDGQGWANKLARQYGISSIPATFLVDGEGKILARDLRGKALEEAVSKALGGS